MGWGRGLMGEGVGGWEGVFAFEEAFGAVEEGGHGEVGVGVVMVVVAVAVGLCGGCV